MSCRKWVVRGLVLVVLVGCLGAGVLYQQWTNPETVRQQVIDMLKQQFPGATITLDGAHLQLLGGVVLSELRLLREGSGTPHDLLHIPQATVYPDKEKLLLSGEFAIRRINLLRPNIRILRDKDGKWNFQGLTGESHPGAALPTIVIQDGTLTVEDHFAGPATWEVHGLELTLLNDPADCISFSGTGSSEVFGDLQIRGSYNRRTNASTLALKTNGLNFTHELVQYVVSQCPSDRGAGLQLEGHADLQLDLSYQPAGAVPFKYDVHCQLRQARLAHPKLPMPLHNLTATLHCNDGNLVLERLKAAVGAGKVEGKASVKLSDIENNFAAEMTVYHMPLDKELIDKLPPSVQKFYERFKPVGTAKAQYFVDVQGGEARRQYFRFEPEEITVCFHKFPYPVERISGLLDYDFLQHTYRFNVVGYSGDHPIHVHGNWKGHHVDAKGHNVDTEAVIEIAADDIPLDQKLQDALQPRLKEVARSFHPTGRGHIRATLRRVPGSLEFHNTYQVHFLDSTVKWDKFPYQLENVSGDLVIYPQNTYEFKNFHGSHHGGDVWVQGRTLPHDAAGREGKLVVSVAGQNICLDDDLHQALLGVPNLPGLGKTWDTFSPAGRFGFRAEVDQVPEQPSDLDLTMDVAGCAMKPSFFKYSLHDVTAQFRYHKDKVELTNFTARHDNSQVSIKQGTVDLYPKGGYYVDLHELRGNPLLADEALLSACPKKVRDTIETINLKDQPFAMQMSRFIVSRGEDPLAPTEAYWDGLFWVHDAELRAGVDLNHVSGTIACEGKYNGSEITGLHGNVYFSEATVYKQTFKDIRSHMFITKDAPQMLRFNLTAPIYGGDVTGQGWVEFNKPLRYEVDLTASQVQLTQFGKQNLGPDQQLNGLASARLHLQGQGGLENLKGNGSIDVPYSPITRLLNLPLLLDLLKFLGLRWPDRTAFEEAHAVFAIDGRRVSVSKLELLGNVVSLYGKGEVNLDGTDLDLNMYSSWGRAEQFLPAGVRNIPSEISKQLLKIEVRGKVGGDSGDLKFSKRPVPGLIDPLMQLHDRMVGKN
jgi:hypothetical protein